MALSTLQVALLEGCEPARFARVEAGLLARGHPLPILVIARLAAPALLLGRHQRAASAIDLPAARARGLPVMRRAGGGRTLLVGEGTVGLFLHTPPGMPLAAAPFPPDRTTNRYVRGLLAALRSLGARQAAWFGRDFVSAGGRQLATVSQEATPDGAVALEAFLSISRPLQPPAELLRARPHSDPRAGGPAPVSLAELSTRTPGFDEVAAALMAGWGGPEGPEPEPVDGALPEAELPPAEEDEAGLSASGLVEIPIGFLEALTAVASGRLVGPRLRGDFIAPATAVAALEGSLDGAPIDTAEVGRRVNEAFHGPGAFIQGVMELDAVARAVLAAGRLAAGSTGVA
jgi:lipoate-protein ligase A